MKKSFVALCATALLLTGCESSNEYGKCIGIISKEDPTLEYNVSVRNTIWSAVFIESVFAPVLWVTSYAKCPTGAKK